MVVQCLELIAFTAEDTGSIPGWVQPKKKAQSKQVNRCLHVFKP